MDIRSTPLLDDFTRFENPVLPPWITTLGHQSPTMGGSDFEPNDLHSVTSSAYLETVQVFPGTQCELWVIQGEGADITEDMSFGLLENPFATGTRRGYSIITGVAIGGSFTGLDRWDNGTPVSLASTGFHSGATDYLLLRIIGTKVQYWRSTDGGANWTLVFDVTDNTYRNFFYPWLRLGSDDAAGPTWAAIGGGVISGPRIIRWVSN